MKRTTIFLIAIAIVSQINAQESGFASQPSIMDLQNPDFDVATEFDEVEPVKGNKFKEFGKGVIYLKSGEVIDGELEMKRYYNRFAKLECYGEVNAKLVSGETKNIKSTEIEWLVTEDKKGRAMTLYRLDAVLIDIENFKEGFTKFSLAHFHTPLRQGSVYFQDGTKKEGQFSVTRGKVKSTAFFLNKEENQYFILKPDSGVSSISTIDNDKVFTYVTYKGYFRDLNKLIKGWSKDKVIGQGSIVFENGTEKKGDIVLYKDEEEESQKRAKILGIYLISDNANQKVEYFEANETINYVNFAFKEENEKYVPLNGEYVNFNDYVDALAKGPANSTKTLQDGYVVMMDGTKKDGKIAATDFKLNYVGAGDKLEQYSATDLEVIDYYVQNIEGEERKFMPMPRRKVDNGSDCIFVEIFYPFEEWSCYRNPFPTNVNKALSTIQKVMSYAAASEIGKMATESVAEKVQKEVVVASAKSTKDLRFASSTGNAAYESTKKISYKLADSRHDGKTYYREWVIVNNYNGEKLIVYIKNDESLLASLFENCAKAKGMSAESAAELYKARKVRDLIGELNTCE